MDALASLFSILASKDLLFPLVSLAFAAVVFFYFIHLLRKEETNAQVDAEKAIVDVRTPMQRQA